MVGGYDDLGQEHWDSACEHMPEEYAAEVQAKLKRYQPLNREPKSDEEVKELGYELNVLETRIAARKMPRFGQPDYEAGLLEWYQEYRYRRKKPLWYEEEYHYTDEGKVIHAKK